MKKSIHQKTEQPLGSMPRGTKRHLNHIIFAKILIIVFLHKAYVMCVFVCEREIMTPCCITYIVGIVILIVRQLDNSIGALQQENKVCQTRCKQQCKHTEIHAKTPGYRSLKWACISVVRLTRGQWATLGLSSKVRRNSSSVLSPSQTYTTSTQTGPSWESRLPFQQGIQTSDTEMREQESPKLTDFPALDAR